MYAKNEAEKTAYLGYYRTYYHGGGTIDGSTSSTDIAQQNPGKGEKEKGHDLGIVTVDGIEYKRYGKLLRESRDFGSWDTSKFSIIYETNIFVICNF